MLRAFLVALALGFLIALCAGSVAYATDKTVDTVTVTDGGSGVSSVSLDCGAQYAVQCQQPMRYRTCAAVSGCAATTTDVLLDMEPRIYDFELSGQNGSSGYACDHFFAFRMVGDAGTCIIARAVPRTVPAYP